MASLVSRRDYSYEFDMTAEGFQQACVQLQSILSVAADTFNEIKMVFGSDNITSIKLTQGYPKKEFTVVGLTSDQLKNVKSVLQRQNIEYNLYFVGAVIRPTMNAYELLKKHLADLESKK